MQVYVYFCLLQIPFFNKSFQHISFPVLQTHNIQHLPNSFMGIVFESKYFLSTVFRFQDRNNFNQKIVKSETQKDCITKKYALKGNKHDSKLPLSFVVSALFRFGVLKKSEKYVKSKNIKARIEDNWQWSSLTRPLTTIHSIGHLIMQQWFDVSESSIGHFHASSAPTRYTLSGR